MTQTLDLGGNDLIVNSVKVGATGPAQAGTVITSSDFSALTGVTAGTVTASKAVIVDASKDISTFGAIGGGSVSVTGAVTARSGTASPAAASAVSALSMGSAGVGVYWGTGSPNTALTAAKGSLFIATDGSSSTTRLFINTNGGTTWTSVPTTA